MTGGGALPAGEELEHRQGRDAGKAVLEGVERRALGEQHQEAVEAFVQVPVLLGLQELQSQRCSEDIDQHITDTQILPTTWLARTRENGRLEKLDQLVDLHQQIDRHLHVCTVVVTRE